jgi:hypothetical protein
MARPYVEKGLMSGTIYMFGEAIACGLFFHKKSGRGLYPSAFLHYSVRRSLACWPTGRSCISFSR